MARKQRPKPKEEGGGEMWLLPYSDLLTLLLALFIVLFAISSADHSQAQQNVVVTFRRGFNSGGISFFNGSANGSQRIINVPSFIPNLSSGQGGQGYLQENSELTQAMQKMNQYIKANNLSGEVTTQLTPRGLLVHIRERALFATGSAALSNQSAEVCAIVANLLASVSENVIISGHTDNVPIHNANFNSNWELSTQRACNFLQAVLADNPHLNPARFRVEGCSQYDPLVPNTTPANRAKNRRVDVLIVRNYQDNNM